MLIPLLFGCSGDPQRETADVRVRLTADLALGLDVDEMRMGWVGVITACVQDRCLEDKTSAILSG
ncbi:MAG: hypothetical protein H7Z75_17820 [Ferruginibacter sp.]|nr:hypothetical protein [Cytophagales bacterium]